MQVEERDKVKLAFRTSNVQAVKRPEPKAGSKLWLCNDKPLTVNIRVQLPSLISGHKAENCMSSLEQRQEDDKIHVMLEAEGSLGLRCSLPGTPPLFSH